MLSTAECAQPSTITISPAAIAAGIGLSERDEICGLLALLEIGGAVSLAKGALDAAQIKLGRDLPDMATRLQVRAKELDNCPAPVEALRHKLWFELTTVLGVGPVLPLSARKMHETTAAIGVVAAELLLPSLHARQEAERAAENGESWGQRLGNKLAETVNNPKSVFTSATVFSFPDIVGSEALAMLEGLKARGVPTSSTRKSSAPSRPGKGKQVLQPLRAGAGCSSPAQSKRQASHLTSLRLKSPPSFRSSAVPRRSRSSRRW